MGPPRWGRRGGAARVVLPVWPAIRRRNFPRGWQPCANLDGGMSGATGSLRLCCAWILASLAEMTDHSVQTTLQYLIRTDEKPIYIASRGGADAQLKISAQFEDKEVPIRDARAMEVPASLDQQGFELHRKPTGVADFYAPRDQWLDVYEAELTELVLGVTGGVAIHIFDHTLRSDSSGVKWG